MAFLQAMCTLMYGLAGCRSKLEVLLIKVFLQWGLKRHVLSHYLFERYRFLLFAEVRECWQYQVLYMRTDMTRCFFEDLIPYVGERVQPLWEQNYSLWTALPQLCDCIGLALNPLNSVCE